jgi:hypothetical protein
MSSSTTTTTTTSTTIDRTSAATACETPFAELRGHGYMRLTTYRKTGEPVATPVWFGPGGRPPLRHHCHCQRQGVAPAPHGPGARGAVYSLGREPWSRCASRGPACFRPRSTRMRSRRCAANTVGNSGFSSGLARVASTRFWR